MKPGGIPTRARVGHSNRPGNLAIALRMSNDTAVQYCEVGKVGSSVNRLLLVKEVQELVLVLAFDVAVPGRSRSS